MCKVVIVIVNWNGWKDTIECLESVFACADDNIRVVVCDNGSQDNSVENICAWARGERRKRGAEKQLQKPIKHIVYTRDQAEKTVQDDDIPLVIVGIGENLGFASGNNIGIRFALAQVDTEYVWLLNNDTQVDRLALSALVEHMQQNKRIGICGAVLCDYEERGKVQTLGSIFNRWLGVARSVGAGVAITEVPKIMLNPRFRIDYPVGASLFVTRCFLNEVGLMAEDYFLYFEEVDWVTRAAARFDVSVCPDCFVYHKEGASIGTSGNPYIRTLLSDFYALRNRLVFAKKFFRFTLPTVFIGLIISAVIRMRRGQWQAARMILRIAWTGGRIKFDPKWSSGR